MKPIALKTIILFLVSFTIHSVQAQDYKSSVGVRVGTFFALSYKVFTGEKGAIETVTGINREAGQSIITLGGFYQRHHLLTPDIPTLRWYYGGGPFLGLGSGEIETSVTLAVIIGLEYTLDNSPVNFFLDGIPYLNLGDNDRFDTEASIGVRYIISSNSQ